MLILSKENSMIFKFCGLFESPSPEWIHMSRELHEYELMLVVEGMLYIVSDSEEFEVPKGQYLLMPPTTQLFYSLPQSGRSLSFCLQITGTEYLTVNRQVQNLQRNMAYSCRYLCLH